VTRVLITGGAGFIGAHLARACLEAGDDVSVLVRPGTDTGRLAGIEGRLRVIRADAGDGGALDAALAAARPDIVYHLAARTRSEAGAAVEAWRSAEDGLGPVLRLVDAASRARPVPRAIVRTGTIAEYPPSDVPMPETGREGPRDLYGAAAAAATHYLEMLVDRLPFPAITARLALVYGPGQSRRFFVPWAIARYLDGRAAPVARPDDRRDLLHVDDAVEALRLIAAHAEGLPPTLNVSTGRAPRMADVAAAIGRLCDAAGPQAMTCANASAAKRPLGLCADPALAERTLGWRARTELEDGLRRTVSWEKEKRRSQEPMDQPHYASRF